MKEGHTTLVGCGPPFTRPKTTQGPQGSKANNGPYGPKVIQGLQGPKQYQGLMGPRLVQCFGALRAPSLKMRTGAIHPNGPAAGLALPVAAPVACHEGLRTQR